MSELFILNNNKKLELSWKGEGSNKLFNEKITRGSPARDQNPGF